MKSMSNNKSPGNKKSRKEFYEGFQNELENLLLKSFYHAKMYREFCKLQRQAVIKLLEKKDKNKRLIKNCIIMSLVNTDLNNSF